MVEAIARQLDRCEVCSRKIHKKDLVRTNMDFLAAEADNYLLYSSYNSSGWTVDTASDAGEISIGPYADRSRVVISDDNTLTESFGSQTWTDSGTLRSTDAIDASSWTSLVFAVDLGPYERETSPETTFTIGLSDSDGSNKEIMATWVTSGSARAWFTMDLADLPSGKTSSTLYFFVKTPSTTNSWWVDRMQVSKNATRPGAFAPTTGAAVDRDDTRMMTVRKVCHRHREVLLSRTEQYGKIAEQRTDEPITVDIQEV